MLSLMSALQVNSGTGRFGSFENWILEGNCLGVVFLEPFFRGVRVGENLDVLGVANLLAGVDVDKNRHRWLLYALAFLRPGVTSGSRNGPSLGAERWGRHFLPVRLHDPLEAKDSTLGDAAGS